MTRRRIAIDVIESDGPIIGAMPLTMADAPGGEFPPVAILVRREGLYFVTQGKTLSISTVEILTELVASGAIPRRRLNLPNRKK